MLMLLQGNLSVDAVTQILGQPEWFEATYKKVRSEEDIDEMANKLGIMSPPLVCPYRVVSLLQIC